jgi:ATP-dependent DNA helicase DinG
VSDTLNDAPAVDEISQWFTTQGLLAQTIPGFRARTAQLQMAQAIYATIKNHDTLIVEAGTGTGKTFAYLVPTLLYGGKVIISTGTKTLQDQLFARDLPAIRQALNAPVIVSLLKGRANYVCHYHLELAQEHGLFASRQDIKALHAITRFIKYTKTGDKSEFTEVPENSPVWDKVTSTRDNCLGAECPSYQKCFVMQARRQAQLADIVIVNHHLFFADILLKDNGIADLLPQANTIIFDEAHQLPEIATLFFGDTFSTSHIVELCRDTLVEGLAQARDVVDWSELCARVEKAAKDCRLALPQEAQKLPLAMLANAHPFFSALQILESHLTELTQTLVQQAERSEGLQSCLRRAQDRLAQLSSWSTATQVETNRGDKNSQETILWLETYLHSVQLHRTPLSIAALFMRHIEDNPKRAWIFTSATLAVKNKFDHYAQQLGLNSEKSLILQSPYDYQQQAMLYVPTGLPIPAAQNYTDEVVATALPLLEVSQGRAFFLCTTLRAVQRIAELLEKHFASHGWDFPLLVQGRASRHSLLERFRQLGNAVLVGSQSFWEGVDVPGKTLSLVVIDKLPFSPPDDPILAARLDALAKAGHSPFQAYQVPQAAITLKQGAGRLIRSETDRGVLMIADTRLVDKPYGRQLWQSLPPFRRTRIQAEALNFLQACNIAAIPE